MFFFFDPLTWIYELQHQISWYFECLSRMLKLFSYVNGNTLVQNVDILHL